MSSAAAALINQHFPHKILNMQFIKASLVSSMTSRLDFSYHMQFLFKPVAGNGIRLFIVSFKDVLNHHRTLGDVWGLDFCASGKFKMFMPEITQNIIVSIPVKISPLTLLLFPGSSVSACISQEHHVKQQ